MQDIQDRVKRSTLFCCIQINTRSSNKLMQWIQTNSIGCVRHTQSSLSGKFLVFEDYLNFWLWLCWLIQQIPSWYTTLQQRQLFVVFWSRRRITLLQRCHNIVFPTSLLRRKTNVVTTSCFRRRFSDLTLTLQQRRDPDVVFLTKF